MKTALIQLNANRTKEENLAKAVLMVCKAIKRGAKFILLPEVFVFRGDITKQNVLQSLAEKVPGKTTEVFQALAKDNKVNILIGTLYERSRIKRKVYNTSVLIDNHGKITAKYRKINLFAANVGKTVFNEAKNFLSGNALAVAKVGAFKVGLTICYDLRFPALYKKYADKRVHIFCVPSSFTKTTGKAHWEALLKARAIENLCYVLAPDQVGKDKKGNKAYGNSMIIDPWGKIIAKASGDKEEIIYADLEKDIVKTSRKLLPLVNKHK